MLVTASLTSVSFELVRSDPWETIMRAEVAGLGGSLSSSGGEVLVCFFIPHCQVSAQNM